MLIKLLVLLKNTIITQIIHSTQLGMNIKTSANNLILIVFVL